MSNSSTYGIGALHLFRVFQTREDFQRMTGEVAPPYDPGRPPKFWYDPQARASTRRTVAYDPVLATTESGLPLTGPDGKPMLDILLLSREEAASVNIWHDQSGQSRPHLPSVPVPLRELQDNEELFFLMPQVVSVRDRNIEEDPGTFTVSDRKLLRAIAQKLDISDGV